MIDTLSRVLALIALFCGTEYALKEGIEAMPLTVDHIVRRSYWWLRLAYLMLLLGLMSAVFLPAWWMVAAAIAAGVVACLEWPLYTLQLRLRESTGGAFGWLQLLPIVGWSILGIALPQLVDMQPSLLVSEACRWVRAQLPDSLHVSSSLAVTVVAFYAILAQPANHVVRCILGKEWDVLLIERVQTGKPIDLSGRPVSIAPETSAEVSATGEHHAPSSLRAGRVVGILERWLLVTLVVIGQFGLIGLVLTAKSLARYSRISDDPTFAEYYLLGTMYSTFMAVMAGLALKAIIGGIAS